MSAGETLSDATVTEGTPQVTIQESSDDDMGTAPYAAATATTPGADIVGFKKTKDTMFDDAMSKIFDATQVVGCQLMDEVIRDLQSAVSHYHIPPSVQCADFYAWLDNRAAASISKYLDSYQKLLTIMGLGAVPDNMGDQLTEMRDSVLAVIRAAFDPVCSNPSTTVLDKSTIQRRLKQLQGLICAAKPSQGVWPKFERDPLTNATTIVDANGNRIKLNLDNSADTSSNIANLADGGGGSSKLDPNVLAALLLARDTQPATEVGGFPVPVGMDTTSAPTTVAEPAPTTIDTSLVDVTKPPEPPRVQTFMGLGPIGLVLVCGLLIAAGVVVWVMRRNKGGRTSGAGIRLGQVTSQAIARP